MDQSITVRNQVAPNNLVFVKLSQTHSSPISLRYSSPSRRLFHRTNQFDVRKSSDRSKSTNGQTQNSSVQNKNTWRTHLYSAKDNLRSQSRKKVKECQPLIPYNQQTNQPGPSEFERSKELKIQRDQQLAPLNQSSSQKEKEQGQIHKIQQSPQQIKSNQELFNQPSLPTLIKHSASQGISIGEHSTGVGLYSEPLEISFTKTRNVTKRALLARMKRRSDVKTPGPCDYSPELVKSSSPRACIGNEKRQSMFAKIAQSTQDQPGPAQYNSQTIQTERSVTIRPLPKIVQINLTPGAGQYDVKFVEHRSPVMKMTTAPRKSIFDLKVDPLKPVCQKLLIGTYEKPSVRKIYLDLY